MKYEWFIGLRYLKAKRKQAFISIITIISIAGVTVGVMALIVILAIMSGFAKNLQEKFLGTQAHINLRMVTPEGMDHYEEVIKEVEAVKGVLSAAPFIYSEVMLSSESSVSGVVLKGIDPDRVGKVTELAHNMKSGRLLLYREPILLSEVIGGYINEVKPVDKELSISVDIPEGFLIYADKNGIHSINRR
jgi:lipoprotein-releasing system permease protein